MHQDTDSPRTPKRKSNTARVVTFAVLATLTILVAVGTLLAVGAILIGAIDAL